MHDDPAPLTLGPYYNPNPTRQQTAAAIERARLVRAAHRNQPLPQTPLLDAEDRAQALAYAADPRSQCATAATVSAPPTPPATPPVPPAVSAFPGIPPVMSQAERRAVISASPFALGAPELVAHIVATPSISVGDGLKMLEALAVPARPAPVSPDDRFRAEFEAGRNAALALRGKTGPGASAADAKAFADGRAAAERLKGGALVHLSEFAEGAAAGRRILGRT